MGATKSKNGGKNEGDDLSLLTNFTADELKEVHDDFIKVILLALTFTFILSEIMTLYNRLYTILLN